MNSEDTFIRKTNYNITDLVSFSILDITSISFIVKKKCDYYINWAET